MSDKKKIFEFDKFVKDLDKRENLKKEQIKKYVAEDPAELKRKRVRLYQERWQNRIRWNRK
jgi:predicted phosphoribosyltransferase